MCQLLEMDASDHPKCHVIRRQTGQSQRYDLSLTQKKGALVLGGIPSSPVLMGESCVSPSAARQINIISSKALSEPQSEPAMKSCSSGTECRQMADCRCYSYNHGSIPASRHLLRLEVQVSSLNSEISIHMFEPTPAVLC